MKEPKKVIKLKPKKVIPPNQKKCIGFRTYIFKGGKGYKLIYE